MTGDVDVRAKKTRRILDACHAIVEHDHFAPPGPRPTAPSAAPVCR